MTRLAPLTSPSGGALPLPYRWLCAHGVTTLTPWHFIDGAAEALGLREEFLREVAAPNPTALRDLMPFARHQAQDDVAGFALDAYGAASGEVVVVHLTWRGAAEAPGWPSMRRFGDVWEWLVAEVVVESRAFCDEGWLATMGDD